MSESTALVPSNPNTALTQGGGLGLDGFKLKPAVMKLVQRTTTVEGAVPGKLLDTLSGNHFDSVVAVPLSIRMGRVLFPPGGELGSKPICRSDDGIVPSPKCETPQCAKCASCDFGPKLWKNFRSTGKKPDCQEKHQLLFVTRDEGLPYYITASGKSNSEVKKLKDAIYRDVLVSKLKGQPRSLFDYSFEIKPLFVQGKKGSYYVLTFTNLRKIETPGEFGPLYEEFILHQKAHEAEISGEEAVTEAVEAEYVTDETGHEEV